MYLLLIIVTIALGLGAQAYVNHQLKKYAQVPNSTYMTGAQVATGMLAYYGVQGVQVQMGGPGQNFFDPRSNSITLDPETFNTATITSTATACHEVGHACQYAENYMPMKVRSAMVPVVNIASNAWIFILLIGIFLNLAGFVELAIILYACAVLFEVVTLPVEFNASKRALQYMQTTGLPTGEVAGSASVLRACAFTYVAAALASFLQLVYLLLASRQE